MPELDLGILALNATLPLSSPFPPPLNPNTPWRKLIMGRFLLVLRLEREFDLSTCQKGLIECLQAKHAKDFLLAVPIEELGQRMMPVEYLTILRCCLMIVNNKGGSLLGIQERAY
ncbi:hypothetical protein FRX31_032541 [Thalictrum thalictroides]|uniref:Uncharacterized protein n=1 Tax=Thalictrum thalictroides TaxID=46969 RepID=A0A7J6V0E5_THATH|nr:hypothetical protein FRX31_032541 [Thalictrum thalictroides]